LKIKRQADFFSIIENNKQFQLFAKKFKEDEIIYPSTYYMLKNGTLIFVVCELEEMILAETVRTPALGCKNTRALSETLFGVEYLNVMKIFTNNDYSKSQKIQKNEMEKILSSKTRPEFARFHIKSSPFYFNGIYTRNDIAYSFSLKKSFKIFYENSSHLRDVADWIMKNIGIPFENLGLTGASQLGLDEEDGDIDIVFLGKEKEVITFKSNFIHSKLPPLEYKRKIWPLRRKWKTYELCSFYVQTENPPIFYSKVKFCEKIKGMLKAMVVDDKYNMLTPTLLKIKLLPEHLSESILIKLNKYFDRNTDMNFILFTGFYRGDFFLNDVITIDSPDIVKIEKQGKSNFALSTSLWDKVRKN